MNHYRVTKAHGERAAGKDASPERVWQKKVDLIHSLRMSLGSQAVRREAKLATVGR